MSLKWEFGALGAVLLVAAAFMMMAEPMNSEPALERTDNFSQLDYDVFDRNFKTNGAACDVGLKNHRLCFKDSPLPTQIAKGDVLNRNIPVLAAEFPILITITPKAEHQKLLRYGKTLALMNKETHVIEDLLHLQETRV